MPSLFTTQTMKICLRPFHVADTQALQAAANNRKIADSVRDSFPHPYTLQHAEEYIRSLKGRDPQTDFVIEADGTFAGRIAVDLKEDIYRTTAEIGYWIAEPYWGRGIATEAIGRMKAYVLEHFDRERLFAMCFESNTGSRKALEKNGFVLEAIRQKAVIKNDVIINDCVYVLIR